ncbi:thioredoxin domain-containing protein 11 [Pectinophora gossypiella]|uniref:thioredoxin domain-containing protein 11 n=1 Tax=Pectinophora gossypiella TaxID=13191 RepID=UPI00214EC731|nr:thioredoxin domain-containing protein 11 [Pectinophora gossypiella]
MFPTADAEEISQVTSLNRNLSPSRDVCDSPGHSQTAKPNNNRELTLNMLIKEVVFCIALALTTYGALHNTPTKISKHPQAVKFFGPHSLVTDWYRGQLSSALVFVNNADVSFVMYYAPWDAESQYVRDEFDKAATVLSHRVHFSAINCWNPGSECRLQHNKIPSWPILMVYTINSRGVLYKGPRDAHSMVKFLELITRPLERVSSTEDLVNLLSICDAVAVGYTPLSDTSKYYSVWYQVALKSREFDVMGEICFAVVTSEDLAADLGVETVPSARLMLWNDTKEYKVGGESQQGWNESSLIPWILDNFTQPVSRIMPMWRKAFSFERFIDGNPMLMLFTPLNPLHQQIPSYDLLREIAMEYNNCKNNETSQWTMELMKLQQVQRLLYEQKDFDKFCQDYKFKPPLRKRSKYYKRAVVSQNNKYPWSNTTHKNQKSGLFNFLVKRGLIISKLMENSEDNSELLASLGLLQECSTRELPAEKSFYENQEQCQSYEESFDFEQDVKRYWGDSETSMLPFEDDPLGSENLIQDSVKHFCKLMMFAKEWGPTAIPEKVDNNNLPKIHGLACASNFSLNMIAVDSVQNYHFAESLGIDISNRKDRTAVVILDPKHESQYVLSGPYSARTLRQFIANFTNKSLKRSLRTHVEDAAHTHYFGSEGKTEQMGINESSIQILELTTRTFKRVVRTPGKVTIVAVCGGACDAHTSRSLAEAARLLTSCGVATQPARLDALRHDLPWHYTVANYPTILVFAAPHDDARDSRAYPMGARVSGAGLAALALRSLAAPHHLRGRLALCTRAKFSTEKKSCLKDLREHLTTVIGRTLKYWRRTEDKQLRDAFLKRLQYLHQVSLDLSLLHISDLTEHSKKQNTLLVSLTTLSKNWDIDTSILKNISVTVRS